MVSTLVLCWSFGESCKQVLPLLSNKRAAGAATRCAGLLSCASLFSWDPTVSLVLCMRCDVRVGICRWDELYVSCSGSVNDGDRDMRFDEGEIRVKFCGRHFVCGVLLDFALSYVGISKP